MAKAGKAYKAVMAALAKKVADLDLMDDQLLDMDANLPIDAPSSDFDLLAQKREELETNIRKMRERIELISAWEQLKNGDWSEEVKSFLKELDLDIATIADSAAGAPVDPMAAAAPPVPPVPAAVPGAPAAPPAPEAAPAPVPEVPAEEAAPAPAEEPLPAPVASKSSASKKNNYEVQVKKGNSSPAPSTLKKGDVTMANQTASKPSLKTELAAQKSAREETQKKAQTRVASAWTIAKTMLPDAPAEIQKHFASNLLLNSTKVLTAALKQTAINAHNTKLAESFKEVHKCELNDFLEDPSVLKKEESAVAAEIKGDAKNASAKTADDRKDAGPQPETYNDGRNGSEPKDIDAGKAGDRPADTINKSEEGEKTLKAAAGKKAHDEKCAGCPECKGGKTAEGEEHAPAPDAAPAGEAAPPAGDVPPAPPAPEAPMGEDGAAAEGATVLTEEKKMDMTEKIDEAEQAIQGLLADIEGEEQAAEEGVSGMTQLEDEGEGFENIPSGDEEQGGGADLNIEEIFNQDEMEDKEGSLANQGETIEAGDDMQSFFGPSASQDLEMSLEPQTASIQDMFSMEGADADPMAVLLGSTKEATDVAGIDVLPALTGEAAKHFQNDEAKGDDRDSESDHDGDIWAEALSGLKAEEQGSHRDKQDARPELKDSPEGKKAAQKKAYTGPIKPSAPKTASVNVAEALLGSFFGDDE